MKNYKIIVGLLALGIVAQIHNSEFYESKSEAESVEHGREPRKPLTSLTEEISTKKQKKKKEKNVSSALDKNAQKEFREALAGYRGMYTLQQLLEKTGGTEVKAETRLRLDLENKLNKYKTEHGNDPYVEKKLKRLEKFKNEEVPNRLKQLSNVKNI